MSIDIIGLIVYGVAVKFFDILELGIKSTTLFIVATPFLFKILSNYIYSLINSNAEISIVLPMDLIVMILQIPVTAFILYVMRYNDLNFGIWIILYSTGIFINYILIQYLVPYFVPYT